MQQVTGAEVDEHQACLRVENKVTQGVEEQIAGEVRNRQRAILFKGLYGMDRCVAGDDASARRRLNKCCKGKMFAP